MNKAYKVVYNESTGTYVAVSEIETSQGKSTQATIVTLSHVKNNEESVKAKIFTFGRVTALLIMMGISPIGHAAFTSLGNGVVATKPGYTDTDGSIAIGSSGANCNTAGDSAYNTWSGYGSQSNAGSIVRRENDDTANASYDLDGIAIGGNCSYATYAARSAFALGVNAYASEFAFAMGRDSLAKGQSSIAIGLRSNAFGNGSVAIGGGEPDPNGAGGLTGTGARAAGNYAVALGNRTSAMGDNSVAIGKGANALNSAVAIGDNANAN